MRKSTGDSQEAEQHVATQVHKFAKNAMRRYTRVLKWVDKENQEDKKMKMEGTTLRMRLAKVKALAHQRFGENAGEATEVEKTALADARLLLSQVLTTAEEMKNENITFECLKLTLQVCIQAEDLNDAKATLEKLKTLRPDDEELRSDNARLNRMEQALTIKKGSGTVEDLQKELRAANEGFAADPANKEIITSKLEAILDLMKTNQVKFELITKLRVGKDIGNAMKLGDPELAVIARKCVGEIQALAQRNALLG